MNLDLLTKLVRLANNNPNENEANLAARKVCKMIADAQFKFTDTSKLQSTNRPTTWNDVKRSEEPQWRSNPYTSNPYSGFNPFENFYKEYQRQEKERKSYDYETQNRYREPKEWYDPVRDAHTRDGGKTWEPKRERYSHVNFEEGRRAARPKRPLKCNRCGKEFQTGFVGMENQFRCNTCHWDIYSESTNEPKKEKVK